MPTAAGAPIGLQRGALFGVTLASLVACATSHARENDGGPDADLPIFGDVRGSRTLHSLTPDERAAMCAYVQSFAGASDDPYLDVPCAIGPVGFITVPGPARCREIDSAVYDERCPNVSDEVACKLGVIRECLAGATEFSPETNAVCLRTSRYECTLLLED